jgi:hypothetical protein
MMLTMMNLRAGMKVGTRMATMAAALLALAGGPATVTAQAGIVLPDEGLRLSASMGAFTARDAVIMAADGRNTRIGSGPSVGLELRYGLLDFAGVYGNVTAAFASVGRGTVIQPAAAGSDQVTIMAGTAGVILGLEALHPDFVPTLRLGGGIKGYAFDITGADNQWRPTGDIGLGFRSGPGNPIGVSAEVRYLPSSFDQGTLPVRGIAPQVQRQTDLLFSVGVNIRL